MGRPCLRGVPRDQGYSGPRLMEIALVAEGLGFPEGPVAMADGSVLVTEIAGKRITRIRPDGSAEVLAECEGGPNGAAIGPDGALWICNNGGAFSYYERDGLTVPGPTPPDHTGGSIQRYDFANGRLETVRSEEHTSELQSLAYLVCRLLLEKKNK